LIARLAEQNGIGFASRESGARNSRAARRDRASLTFDSPLAAGSLKPSHASGKNTPMTDATSDPTEAAAPPRAAEYPRFARPQRVAFVQSSWHRDIVGQCWLAFARQIEVRGIVASQVDLFEVPGSFEIPLHVQILAKTRRYTAIVAAGLVVDSGMQGFVAQTVIQALMEVQLRTEVPVFSAVVTPQQFDGTAAQADFFQQHFASKGAEVADACADTLLSLERLRGQVAAGIV
jgi:6,7-dimethyl-8-ribityllumazine synthase